MKYTLVIALLTSAFACGSSSKSDPVAELLAASGDVQESAAAQPTAWKATATGAVYHSGDGVRTGVDASARVRVVRGDGILRMGPGSLIRFGATNAADSGIALETGEATIEAHGIELSIDTASGVTRVAPGAVARMRTTEDGDTEVEILVGQAVLESEDAPALVVRAGEATDVTRFSTLSERANAPADAGIEPQDASVISEALEDAAPADAAPADAAPADAVDDADDEPGQLRLRGRKIKLQPSPTKTTGTLTAGEVATIHAPTVPAALRLEVGDACPGESVVELGKGRRRRYFAGTSAIGVAAVAGRHPYRIYCNERGTLKPSSVRGAIAVRRDSGRRKVTTTAPRNEIDADGRKYRLLYQNRAPTIVLRWPRAPTDSEYELAIESKNGKTRSFRSKKPSRMLSSGVLPDGTYTWQFRTGNGRAQSLKSQLVLDFDNASPAAQIEKVSWIDGKVEIRGVASEGSEITVAGEAVEVDTHFRFTITAAPKPGAIGIAVRIVRPAGDVHYYQVPLPRQK